MKLSNSILKSIFIVSIFSVTLITIKFTIFLYTNYQAEKGKLKKQYIEQKKENLKKEVNKVYEYISYHEKRINLNLRKNLENRVNQAYNIAIRIYEENKNKKTEEEIKSLIVFALKNISYENSRNYFFINTNNGKAILFNKNSYLKQDKDVWNLQDIKGNYIIRRQSEIALKKGSGFIQNYFIKPDLKNNKQYPKLSFIKNFKPFNWHIGMGEYLDDVLKNSKKEILDYIAFIRYDQDGYIYVNTTNKKVLIFDGKRLDIPKNYPNDSLFEKQLNAIKNDSGDFFEYSFKKLNTEEKFPKLGFVKEYKKWGWIIGTGLYIDQVDEYAQYKSNSLRNTLLYQFYILVIFLVITSIIVFLISKKISNIVNVNVAFLIDSFKKASKEFKPIDENKLTYEEFKSLGNSLNEVLIARNESDNKLKRYIDILNNSVITSTTDSKGIITDVSKAFCNISGYTKKELVGKSHNIIKHEDMPKEIYKTLWGTIKKGKIWKGELKNKKKNGDYYWVDTTIEPIIESQKIVGFTAVRYDITDKKQVEYLSITDDLTNLYNRRYFNKKIEDEINRAKREKKFLSLLILDVDYFKKYNDTYGHLLGDKTLKVVAEVLNSMTKRSSDYAFRLGGEEFGIIITDEDENKAYEYAQKIRQKIQELHIEHKTSEVSNHLTVSIGVLTKAALDIKSSNEIYKLADEALYKAKENGRNQVSLSNI